MEVAEQLQEIIRASLNKAGGSLEEQYATFDFDNSCIVNDIQEATLAYICKNLLLKNDHLLPTGYTDRAVYHRDVFLGYHNLLNENRVKDAYFYAVKTMAGFAKSEMDKLVSEVIQSEGEVLGRQNLFGIDVAKGLAVRPQVKTLMELLLAAKCKIYVVTASSEEVVKSALKFWGFPEVTCIGVRNKEVEGIFSDVVEEPAPIIDGKVDCIKKFISENEHPILAVGDSMNDLPMLEYSGIRVVVNRENALSKKAKEEGWFLV